MFNEHGYLQVNSREDLAEAIRINEAAGAIGQAHLMRALLQRRICYLPLLPRESASKFKSFVRGAGSRPSIALIGDDDGLDRGPPGWDLAARSIAWARSVLIHAAAAELEHYQAAIEAAQQVGRVLIIECSTATFMAWATAVRTAQHRPTVLAIIPRGGVHPAPMPREAMQ